MDPRKAVAAGVAVVLLGGLAPVAVTSGRVEAAPSGRIAFLHLGDRGTEGLYVANGDGSGARPLTALLGGRLPSSYAWSPEGSQIVFASDHYDVYDDFERAFDDDIFVMNADGSAVRNLTRSYGFEHGYGYSLRAPVWSPDGSKIAFVRIVPDQPFGIYVMNADGTGLIEIAIDNRSAEQNGLAPGNLAWSPDGARIAYDTTFEDYSAECDWQSDIWSVPALGGTPQLEVRSGCSPSWSPDGSQLAFVRDYDWLTVWVRDMASGAERQLSTREAVDPSWSADGTKLVYSGPGDYYSWEIFAINADGTEETLVYGDEDEPQLSPQWQPCPSDCPGAGNRTPSWTKGSETLSYSSYPRIWGEAVPDLGGQWLKFSVFWKRDGRWVRRFVEGEPLRSGSDPFYSFTAYIDVLKFNVRCKIKVSFAGNARYRPSTSWIRYEGSRVLSC